MDFITEFMSDARHTSGQNNPVTDALSSAPCLDVITARILFDLRDLGCFTALCYGYRESSSRLPWATVPLLCTSEHGNPLPNIHPAVQLSSNLVSCPRRSQLRSTSSFVTLPSRSPCSAHVTAHTKCPNRGSAAFKLIPCNAFPTTRLP